MATALLLCLVAAAADAAAVWKVSKDGAHFFIAGTLHLLAPADYPLPAAYASAYGGADTLVFETDLATMASPAFQARMQEAMMLPPGQDLEGRLSRDTYRDLRRHLAARGLAVEGLNRFRPSMVAMTVSLIEMQRLGLTAEGVDKHFHDRATGDGRVVEWLESPEQQLAFLLALDGGDQDAYMAYTLDDMTNLPELLGGLRDAWRAGDMARLAALAIDDFKADYADIYEVMIVGRNAAWVPQLEAMVADPDVEFVLVGALHLAGEDSVLVALQERGFVVERCAEAC